MQREYDIKTSRVVALSGVFLAINTLVFFAINMVQPATLFLMFVSGLFPIAVMIEFGKKYSLTYSIASCIIAGLVLANKLQAAEYIILFGFYGYVKNLIEGYGQNKKGRFTIMMKIVYSTVVGNILLILIQAVFIPDIWSLPIFKYGRWTAVLLWIVYVIVFLLLDKVGTEFVGFYIEQRKKLIKNDR